MKNEKKEKNKHKSYLGLRIFISILMTATVLFAYYYPELCHKSVRDVIYYTAKEHFNFESVDRFMFTLQEKSND